MRVVSTMKRNPTTTKRIFTMVLLALLISAPVPSSGGLVALGQKKSKSATKNTTSYTCPMHSEVTSRRPGKCPKCGMALRVAKNTVESPASPVPMNNTTASATDKKGVVSSIRIPDVTIYNQNGRRLNFFTDLVKGKVVAINFIFTTCTTICPPLTATFRRVQQELGEHMGRDIVLISISVDPTVDTPERLFDFAAKFKAGPGWTFVTGDGPQIDELLQAFGVAVVNKNDHTPMILVGNEAKGYWTRTYGLSSPATLVKVITEALEHK